MAPQLRNTYKYWFKVDHVNVHCGITSNLAASEQEHLNSGECSIYKGRHYHWARGHIVQVGMATTKEAAIHWKRENACNYGWN